jgi:transcription elongation factor GreA
VVAELEALHASLAEGPAAQTVSVDGAAAAAAAAAHGSLREALSERIEHLRRVLAQSELDDERVGGDWVTPGSVVTVRYADGEEDKGIVASPLAGSGVLDGLTAFSPTSPLGQGLIGAGVGDVITYDAPRGEITVTIVKVEG